jgi:uncharacterized membrane protein YdfJ with MMPL/SSD domain
MMLHRNAATAAASRASGQATNADFHRPVAMVIIALLLLLLLLLLAATMRMSGCAGLPSQLGSGFPSREGWIQGLVTGRQAG